MDMFHGAQGLHRWSGKTHGATWSVVAIKDSSGGIGNSEQVELQLTGEWRSG